MDAPFTCVDDLEEALERAKAIADGKDNVAGPNIVQQCINLGAHDEIRVDLVPILMRDGTRYFDHLDNEKAQLQLLQVVEGEQVTLLLPRNLHQSRSRSIFPTTCQSARSDSGFDAGR